MRRILNAIVFVFIGAVVLCAQPDRWQQRVDYKMDVDFNIKKHQLHGVQKLVFTNNSPDTLSKIFYHLYLNAFQPRSAMDVQSRHIADPDPRVTDRISKLKKGEEGYTKITSLMLNGKSVEYKTVGTILEVELDDPILPHSTVTLDMEFLSQIPLQIRRTGRFNKEGIEYSVAQWYPKLCNYDYMGWHADPYIGREFYGVWGDFDVKITLPSNYVVAATGLLQNKDEVGYGYSNKEPKKRDKTLKWHFVAKNVHDFVWAADPDYTQLVHKMEDGKVLRFFYQPGEKTSENWEQLPAIMEEVFKFANKKYGEYPYSEYSFIQGGDGGMEYPMATLITGERSLRSLVGVAVHELMHSWYQMVLGSNELLYPWMDEGFTSYAEQEVTNHLYSQGFLKGQPSQNPHNSSVLSYINFTQSGLEEPLSTHADRYITNTAYGYGVYTKGAVFLEQLRYIIGEDAFDKGMLRYFNEWKFKHPNPNDFIRIMEKTSGLELQWYLQYFINTTFTIDYGISDLRGNELVLTRNGGMPMPLDISVYLKDGSVKKYYVPLDIMRGEKKGDYFFDDFKISKDWPYLNTSFSIFIDNYLRDINFIEIDSSHRLADTDRSNNKWPRLMKVPEATK